MEFNDFGLLEPSWEYSGRPLGTSRSLFGTSWGHLGLSWATRGLLAPSWELLGTLLARFGTLLASPGRLFGAKRGGIRKRTRKVAGWAAPGREEGPICLYNVYVDIVVCVHVCTVHVYMHIYI